MRFQQQRGVTPLLLSCDPIIHLPLNVICFVLFIIIHQIILGKLETGGRLMLLNISTFTVSESST